MIVDCPLLRGGLVLVDTPGVCDPGAQTERALKAIATSDLVILVLNASQLLTQNEQDLAIQWITQGLGKPVVPVLNWMNIVEPRDRDELRRRLDRWSREQLGGELGRHWFEVNARGALMHVLGQGPAATDDFLALRSALAGLAGDQRRRLQVHSRRGQLRADVAEARRTNLDVLQRIRRDADRVERERQAARRDLRQLINRFDALAKLQRESLTAKATAVLDTKLDRLVGFWFQGESKQRLNENASDWYQNTLSEGVEEIEKEAEGALLALTGDGLRRPESMTIKEHLILKARLEVGDLKPTGISEGAVAGSAWAGALLGQALIPIPVVGFFAGMIAGGWLAEKLGRHEPDYVAAYAEKAREAWKASAAEVTRLLYEQFDGRATTLNRQLSRLLVRTGTGAAGAKGLADELRGREAAEAALERCEQLLRVPEGTAR